MLINSATPLARAPNPSSLLYFNPHSAFPNPQLS
jgi:hypothetical protein